MSILKLTKGPSGPFEAFEDRGAPLKLKKVDERHGSLEHFRSFFHFWLTLAVQESDLDCWHVLSSAN